MEKEEIRKKIMLSNGNNVIIYIEQPIRKIGLVQQGKMGFSHFQSVIM